VLVLVLLYFDPNFKLEYRIKFFVFTIIFVALAPNLFHHNNVGVTSVRTSNFKMELVRSIPLYFVAMPHSMVIITKTSFTTTPAHTIVSMKFRPQTPRGTNLVIMHIVMPKEVDKIFVGQPSNPKGRRSRPLKLP
jgi:hypothetical protein